MAYALIAWNHANLSAAERADVEGGFNQLSTIPFFEGLRLVEEDSPGWNDVMNYVHQVVRDHPGTEAVVVMPARGARVGGWVARPLAQADLQFAKSIMNMAGSATYPILLKPPAPGGPGDWRNAPVHGEGVDP